MGGEAVEEDGVGDCIESSREVQQNQDADAAGVSSDEEIIGDLHQGSLL